MPPASSHRLIGSMILPISLRALAVTQASSRFATQRVARRLLSACSLADSPSAPQPGSPDRQKSTSPSILEIERKFAPTKTSMQQIASNSGTPPFKSLIHHGTTNLEDLYYDTANEVLCRAGVWLRRRGDRWEAKVRVGGDFTNSAFEEITNVKDISAMLGKLVPGATLDPHDGPTGGQVLEVAKLVSERNKFLVDGKYTVVLDVTDFGHVVGEVELERRIAVTGEVEGDTTKTKGEDQVKRAQIIVEMDREIDDFMKSYVWAFPPGKPVGKLSAYFALKQRK